MFGLIKKWFISLLNFRGLKTSVFNVPDHTKCVFLNNQPGITRSTFINLNPDEYSQSLDYYPFVVKINTCNGSNYFSNRRCVANKAENINLHFFNMITGKNESKTIINILHVAVNVHLIVESVTQIKKWNKKLCQREYKNPVKHHVLESIITLGILES